MHTSPWRRGAGLAFLATAWMFASAGTVFTDWSGTASVYSYTSIGDPWNLEDTCSAELPLQGHLPIIDQLICVSQAVYGYAESGVSVEMAVWTSGLTTTVAVGGWIQRYPFAETPSDFDSDFDQSVNIEVTDQGAVHLQGHVIRDWGSTATVRLENDQGVVAEYVAVPEEPGTFDDTVALDAGSYLLTVKVQALPGPVGDLSGVGGFADVDLAVLVVPVVSVEAATWSRLKALYR